MVFGRYTLVRENKRFIQCYLQKIVQNMWPMASLHLCRYYIFLKTADIRDNKYVQCVFLVSLLSGYHRKKYEY